MATQAARILNWRGIQLPLATSRYAMLSVCLLAQLITIGLTWPLWQVRSYPPLMPAIDLPQVSFGWILIASLFWTMVRPRSGWIAHALLLLTSFAFDQFRTQPQFISIAVLIALVAEEGSAQVARWVFVSLWLWAGLHKFLSPDWMTNQAWDLVASFGLPSDRFYVVFGISVALVEVLLAICVLIQPRWAAWACLAFHFGVIVFLSPWVHAWNVSVIPWNLCVGVVGFWLLQQTKADRPRDIWEWSVAGLLLVMPAGFYFGWVDHGIANVLYSDHLPRGLIVSPTGVKQIEGWGKLRVPFPNERRLLRSYFERSAEPGCKLHIYDPREWLDDQYFVQTNSHRAIEISRERFLKQEPHEVAGIELDSPRSLFALNRAGVRMLKRTPESMVYAVQFSEQDFDPVLFDQLHGLPNLEQLQLAQTDVQDADLRRLIGLRKLVGIGLENTGITDTGVDYLDRIPSLLYIEHANTEISPLALRNYRTQESMEGRP